MKKSNNTIIQKNFTPMQIHNTKENQNTVGFLKNNFELYWSPTLKKQRYNTLSQATKYSVSLAI